MLQGLLRWFAHVDRQWPNVTGYNAIVRAVINNRALLTFLSVIGILAFATDIFNFSLNIDSENHAYDFGAKGGWVAQGRWGMYLLNRLLLPDAVMPVIPIVIAVVGAVIGAAFFVHTLSPMRGIRDYIAAPIAIACPIIYFAFYFTTLGYGVGIAFAVTGLGVYWLSQAKWYTALAASLCFCFGMAIYQAVLPLVAVVFGLYVVSFILEKEKFPLMQVLKHGAVFIGSLALAYALYAVLNKAFLNYMEIAYDASYMSGFLTYQTTWDYFINTVEKTWPIALNYYTGGKDYYLYDLLSLKVLFYFTLTVTLLRIIGARSSIWVRLVAILLLAAVMVAPMLMHLLNNGYMPPRTVMGVPQVLAGLVFFAMGSRSKIIQSITAILAVACLYNFCVANNRFAFSNMMVWKADRELSVKIQEQIAKVLPKIAPVSDPWAVYPIEIVGWIEYPETPIFTQREVVGASFYKWAAGDVERIERLFKTMGVYRFRAATHQERLSVIEKAKTMPSWPYEGSVDVINGVIVIKFREYNPNQLMVICQPPLDQDPVCIKNKPLQ
jgi:hypothetical protein